MGEAFLQAGGLQLRYRVEGRGPDLLLLHGWGGSIESFGPVIAGLAASQRVTAIDFPGHGQSELPPHAWRVSDFLDCLLEFMNAVDLRQPNIVAHSFGGRVTIKLASAHPERAGKLLMTAAAGIPAHRTLGQRLKRRAGAAAGAMQASLRALPATRGLADALHRRFYRYVASSDYRNAGPLRETLKNVLAEDLTPYLPQVHSKVLLVWGDRDEETPLDIGRKMAALIPDNELVVFPGAGHFPYLDHTNKFLLHAQRFFRDEGES